MRKILALLFALCLMLALCACGSGSGAASNASAASTPQATAKATAEPSLEPTPEPTPDPEAEAMVYIDEAKKLMGEENYYEAALRLVDCQKEYPDTEAANLGGDLLDEIASILKPNEPKTGELERHFPFYGKNCVRATAETWPFEMTIRDVEDESLYVRFYVRQGETSEVYLPSSEYYCMIRQGPIWFNDETGFGDLGTSSNFGGDTLKMTSGVNGNTFSWHEWSPTF